MHALSHVSTDVASQRGDDGRIHAHPDPRSGELAVLVQLPNTAHFDGRRSTAYYYVLAHSNFENTISQLTRCWVGGQRCPVRNLWNSRAHGLSARGLGMTSSAGANRRQSGLWPEQARHYWHPYPGNASVSSMLTTLTRKCRAASVAS